MWLWRTGGGSKKKDPVPEKRTKIEAKTKPKRAVEKYYCMECLELYFSGKREERFAMLCRIDVSSVNRHKNRWHTTSESCMYTVVPSTAPQVKALERRYAKSVPTPAALSKVAPSSIQLSRPLEEGPTLVSRLEPTTSIAEVDVPEKPERSSKTSPKNQATLLSYKQSTTTVSSGTEVTLDNVMDAISSLSLKVDNFGKKHANLEQLLFEDDDVRTAVLARRQSDDICHLADISEFLQFFYDEESETAILCCLPCYKLHLAAKPTLCGFSPFQAQQIIYSSGNGTLGTGILLNKDTTRLLIEGRNQTWYRQKKSCIDHLCLIGDGSKVHKNAMEVYQRQLKIMKRKTAATSNILRPTIADLKLGAGTRDFETLVSFLACCFADVGDIGHSRNNFSDILYCLEKTFNGRINAWLNHPLPSTQLPPHFWATVDKVTPSRTTNQAVLVVACDKTDVPCPIPVAATSVYTELEQPSYDKMADLLIKVIEDNFSKEVLSRLCDVAADGPYLASGYRARLLEVWNIVGGMDQLELPVTCDAAHVLYLAVSGVKDSNTPSGTFFQRFVKRCNVFNTSLAHGKGFAFLQLIDESARRPVAYATQRFQRFTKSSYEQWLKIENSYPSFWKAFEKLHPNRVEEEEPQYMIARLDFVTDLLVDLMTRVQSLDTPI